MRVLVLADDYWHPAGVPQAGLKPLCEQGFEFDWITDAKDWTPVKMADYPLVVLSKSNNVTSTDQTPWMTDGVQSSFVRYVQSGHGLAVIHSGSAGYQQCAELRRLMGGVFIQHPPQCPITWVPHTTHGLTTGLGEFTMQDEHYFMSLDADDVEVFLVSKSQHGEQPAGWLRTEGQGCVCMLTPGHNLDVWLHPTYQQLILSSLRWCAQL
ncbi:MAG: ThuA domain-containing protein [Chloroflexi bacterium]|nr:ThuA domain-containing protein [Chloroflexota bacterium]MCL5275177.1 ThuA domain-containing protein [Chloroflexota bacterium]